MPRTLTAVAAALLLAPQPVRADVVLEWNAIAVATVRTQNPFAQARYVAITQLAVYEAVNAIVGQGEPFLGTINAPAWASVDAAAASAAHRVLTEYLPSSSLDDALANTLEDIPDGPAEDAGIATGRAAAEAMILLRANDGTQAPAFYTPGAPAPGAWQITPLCPAMGGVFLEWASATPFGIPSAAAFRASPPPALTSAQYAKDYDEVRRVGGISSAERPQDRTTVARFYAVTAGTAVWNTAARQIAAAQGRSISDNARALALLNMALADAAIASFETKYHYNLWRPITAIRDGYADGNDKTDGDIGFTPLVFTPCFPSYPSAHASTGYAGSEILRRLYGAGEHAIVLSNPIVPGVTLQYTTLKAITDDIDDARVYGGIHFRFDQDGGALQGREIATYLVKSKLRLFAADQE